MSTALKKTTEFKPTSLNWLGEFPSRWNVQPGLAVLQERQVKNIGLVEPTVLSLSYGRVVIKPQDKLRGLVPESFETYQIVEAGNIIVRPTDLQNDHVSLRVGQAKDRGIITSAYLCLETQGALTEDFAHLLLHAYDIKKVFYGLGSGLRQNLSWVDFRRLPIPVPPADEQAQIVRFIRHLDLRVNRLIKNKRRLIELLNEQKQAIIQRAVTLGVNPNIQLKPSGIEWLGDIPKNWGRTRLKFEASHIVDCLHATPMYLSDGVYPAIRTADIEPGNIRLERARKISGQEFEKWTARHKPEMGDILYSREGERFGIAANVPADIDLCISQRMMVFRIREPQNSEYLMWQLNCQHVYLQASLYVVGSTAPHVNVDQIKNFQLALPPVQEQAAIVDHIRKACSSINNTVAKSEREIEFVREFRGRLVADIVTGQLDVRHLELTEVEESLIESIDSGESDEIDNSVEEEAAE